MKVKVGDKVYDSNDVPIMAIITEQDRKHIADMAPYATKYCAYPDDWFMSGDEILAWMREGT